jgi:hypothetical protein
LEEINVKACSHFRNGYEEADIVQSNGYPWNGWFIGYDKGKEVISNFQSGLRWDYLEHLKNNPKCRREAKIYLREVKRLLNDIEGEWKRVTE